ncbi:MAG TPA: MXAN_2562 family outer membrane beta-barrel protein [Candidatus Acidoferrum sp.]|nr:MXAN_2562 family outer membrane beta-barrel protein [Candidatus Acidoferrum sp.]
MPLLPRPVLRSLPLLVVGSLAALPAIQHAAAAAPPVELGNTTIKLELRLRDDAGNFVPRSAEENLRFMNLANCTCGAVTEPQILERSQFGVRFSLENATNTLPTEAVRVWVGTSCDSATTEQRDNNCKRLDEFAALAELRSPQDYPISVRDLVASRASASDACPRAEADRWVYALIDPSDDGIGDGDHKFLLKVTTDTRPPTEPLSASLESGEGAARVQWELDDARAADIQWIQFLCARTDGSPPSADGLPSVDPQYRTAFQVCGRDEGSQCPRPLGSQESEVDAGTQVDAGDIEADAAVEAALGDPGDAGADGGSADASTPSQCDDLPGDLEHLDALALCGEATSTDSDYRIGNLQNGVTYRVVMVLVDRSRNPTAVDLGEATPAAVQDFWEDYKDKGGGAKGGCSAGQVGFGGGLALALALTLGGLGLRVRSHRRRRGGRGAGGVGGAAVILALALSPRLASAQPWWEDSDQQPVQEKVGSVPHWGMELKLGPYFPDVDGDPALDPGEKPFEQMFGDGPFLMSEITVDRYLLYPMGQLGVSVTAGFMTRSARAFELGANGDPVIDMDTGKPKRSSDTNVFRLFPASVGVVYRFTELDDRLRIPLVPYGRVGLSYYGWRVSKPGGGAAVVDGDRAFGGSLGWQATAGLAVRAERIDRDAEMGLRNETGIEHAGLVFEFTYAKVDGFGASDKLRVGDATFFGGINFEF